MTPGDTGKHISKGGGRSLNNMAVITSPVQDLTVTRNKLARKWSTVTLEILFHRSASLVKAAAVLTVTFQYSLVLLFSTRNLILIEGGWRRGIKHISSQGGGERSA